MSQIDGKSPSDNDDNYEKEEEQKISKKFPPGLPSKKRKKEKTNFRKRTMKLKPGRLTISLKNRKSFRGSKTKIPTTNFKSKKMKKQKFLFPLKRKISEEKVPTPKLGKRCYLGGKAKGKPPPIEENQDKHESDDDSDSAYFSRISLGQYQQLNDKSGASTSCEYEEEKPQYINPSHIECQKEYSEEDELKELEMWGRNILENYFCVVRNWRNYRELFRNTSK